MNPEKSKIEFWAEGTDIACALLYNRTDELIKNNVEVYVKIAYPPRKYKEGGIGSQRMTDLTRLLEYHLPLLGFIESRSQIVSLTIEKAVSKTPGIIFFMQEVEE